MKKWHWWLAAVAVLVLATNTKKVATMMKKPKGIRNNNPGNIRTTESTRWQGQVGDDGTGFVVFDTAESGIRALARVVRTYATSYGITTVAGIVSRWAPSNENDTAAYIRHVAKKMDVGDTQPLQFTKNQLLALVSSIILHENGQQPYSESQLLAGIKAAGWAV